MFTNGRASARPFHAAGSNDDPNNHLNALRLDASYAYRQTWSAGVGVFDTTGTRDLTLLTPSPLTGSNSGSPNSRGYILQFEYVPFGKSDSWGHPSQNDSLFVFSWTAF